MSSFNPKTNKCSRCGFMFAAYRSQCPSCKQWHTPGVAANPMITEDGVSPVDGTVILSQVNQELETRRIRTGPWDACFGGGIALTSVNLIGGSPGAGKSTMALQLSDRLADVVGREVLYVGGEEASGEIKSRAVRLDLICMNLLRVLPMGALDNLGDAMINRKPAAIIIDSLPSLIDSEDAALHVCSAMKNYAVEYNAPVIIIDHITKQDDFAGHMTLQHKVDALFTLYPDGNSGQLPTRTMFTEKNRFGKAQVSVRLLMTEKGLIGPIPDDLVKQEK